MKNLFAMTGRITAIHSEPLTFDGTFQDLCRPFARIPGTVILMSGGDSDCARYHILAALPWLTMTGKGQKIRFTVDAKTQTLTGDPFVSLHNVIKVCRIDGDHLPKPVGAGLFGYLSYDLKDQLEKLPRTTVDDLALPDVLLYAPSFVVLHDRMTYRTNLCTTERILKDGTPVCPDINRFRKLISCTSVSDGTFSSNAGCLQASFNRDEYLSTVEKIRDYITAGDVYQVNLSRRFCTSFSGDPFNLFCDLFDRNPASFFSYINAGNHFIVSTSPERFLKRTKNRVETRPIKGTRPRGKNGQEDHHLQEELLKSPKEDAELSMIVDLLRNDLGKVCKRGSVKVTEHKRIEAYRNVYHLLSRIEGELCSASGSVDLIRAAFPGGSITGCPKIRAMEIIDELEPVRRHVYTGAIGYIGFHDTMDLSIAIRTATILSNTILFSVGGGIVYDSVPQEEYAETQHKGETLSEVIANHSKMPQETTYVWINGKIVPVDQATVSVADPLVQYGCGLFETIRVQKGKPLSLTAHINRFERSWIKLFACPPPDLTWGDIITAVLQANRLCEGVAAIKIIAGPGSRQHPPFRPVLIVQCRPYVHRLSGTNKQGLRLITYPHPRQSSLADHKTLNHWDYIRAGQWAAQSNADEA
ncbi:MAG: aminodeoxychorismate synthase component I, partial [Syntrophaceae bacterium]|nr:aminodeoxychorismate synthase component I [Syntrophaceae bacterium]